MVELRTVRIGDLGRVVTGKTPPSAQPELFGGDYPFLTPTDIDGAARYIEPERFLSPEGRDYQQRLMLPARAVCVVCIGATIGKVCMTGRPSFTNQQINSVVVNEDEHDPFFVYHVMTTLRDELKSNAGGAATPIINKTAFSEIEVSVPALPVQRRIAGILSAYDEVIENSQRRIRILETMARVFYREWFVHLRFPGHEKLPRVASRLGDIPRGWDVRPLAELCSRMESGGTPKRTNAEYWDGGDIDWYKTGELWDGFLFDSQEKITALGQQESNARLFEPSTILMAIYGSPTVGRMGILTRRASCNQAALGLVADRERISQTFLFFVLLSLREHFNGLAQGAAQQNISKEKVANAVAVVPPRSLVAAFDKLAEPIFGQVETLQRQIQNLRRTRDLLLPRLLSGQVELETN
jgi:type I restriction enzyme S subunit